jgi:hypothetical protein
MENEISLNLIARVSTFYDKDKGKNTKEMVEPTKFHDKWKLPTPSCIATFSFSFITCFELYSGSFK